MSEQANRLQVPQGRWKHVRLKWLFHPSADANRPDEEVLSVYRDYGVIPKSSRNDNFNVTPQNLDRYLLVRPGDLVVNRMKAWQGSLGISQHRGIVSGDYEVLRPRSGDLEPRFAHHLLRSSVLVGEYRVRSTGIRPSQWRLYWEQMSNIEVSIPCVEEQRRIAGYLDRETAQIDALIAKQEQLIETLRERLEATIRSVLVSGLIPARPGKPSGIKWLGEVPTHWRVVPTRYLCTITTGSEDSGNATDDGEYPFYVRGREVLRIGKYSFDGEAVMTPGDGQGGVGKVFHYANGRFEAHQRVYVFKDFKGIRAQYFFHYLSTFLQPVAFAGNNKVTMESLRRPLLAEFKVLVPPENEQRAILAYIDEQAARGDALIAKAGEFIALVRERRTALITGAVTGRIDVSTGKQREGA